jgi:hypothetical protein
MGISEGRALTSQGHTFPDQVHVANPADEGIRPCHASTRSTRSVFAMSCRIAAARCPSRRACRSSVIDHRAPAAQGHTTVRRTPASSIA